MIDAVRLGLDPGDATVLERYQRWRRFDTLAMSLSTDGLNRLFSNRSDVLRLFRDIGLGVGLISSLKLTHLMRSERLTEDYLARLAEGIHYSGVLLDYLRGIRPAPRTTLGRVADFLRIMRLTRPHRRILRAAFRGNSRAWQTIASMRRHEKD